MLEHIVTTNVVSHMDHHPSVRLTARFQKQAFVWDPTCDSSWRSHEEFFSRQPNRPCLAGLLQSNWQGQSSETPARTTSIRNQRPQLEMDKGVSLWPNTKNCCSGKWKVLNSACDIWGPSGFGPRPNTVFNIHLWPGTGQLVPKSTRTLVNSYPFLVNSYHRQLVPKSTHTLVYL